MIKSLQSLRLIFAIMIFLHHFPNASNGAGLFAAGGPLGVCFFIMLSGFVMSAGYGEKVLSENFDFKHYFLKRVIRLWPLHLLCLLGFVILHYQTSFSSIRNIGLLGINSLMIQSWIPIKGVYFSGNAVSWCLCDLMFCYLMFPTLYRFVSRVNTKTLLFWGLLVVAIYYIIIHLIPDDKVHAIVYISPVFRLLDFILGILVYQFFQSLCNEKTRSHLEGSSKIKLTIIEICSIIFISGYILLYPLLLEKYNLVSMWWPVCAFIIVLYSLLGTYRGGYVSDILQNSMLQKLSMISFTFYMIHQMSISVIISAFDKLQIHIPYSMKFIVCMVIIIFAAIIVNKFYEKPVADYFTKKI